MPFLQRSLGTSQILIMAYVFLSTWEVNVRSWVQLQQKVCDRRGHLICLTSRAVSQGQARPRVSSLGALSPNFIRGFRLSSHVPSEGNMFVYPMFASKKGF